MHEGGRPCAHWMFVCRQVSIGVHNSVSRSNELRETVRHAGTLRRKQTPRDTMKQEGSAAVILERISWHPCHETTGFYRRQEPDT
jgi:hypothetical protein